ncbi:twin-arginine translocation signal domain-containing protein [Kribbella amoyensis]|uniref:twin-arginine translocation signal domain-containing protein n=1 Tax=Kribbella amoyensis TaxID=996641 RepID=UPI0011A4738D|nr:twin-arginine translocation signal domain-containing protein [Kribbella amoyensis]
MTRISRRSALKLVGAAAVAVGTGGLTGCGTGSGQVGNAGKDAAPFPEYHPRTLVKPDLPGTEGGIQDAFLKYPRQPVRTVAEKPGDGSVVTAVVITYGSAPAPAERNRLWAALNQAMGVDLRLTIVNAADLNAKYATLMAGGDLPDIIATIDTTMPNALAFTQAKCADLTEYLSGDAIKAYPNLANLPAFAWQSVGRIGGRLYGIPVPRPRMGGANFGNAEALTRAGITGSGISAEQFGAGLGQLVGGRRYPLGGNSFGTYYHLWADGIAGS